MIAYFNGKFIPSEKLTISADDRGFLFADGLYEAIRAYGGKLFRVEEHLDRLAYGARNLRLIQSDFGYLKNEIIELLYRNGIEDKDVLIYLQVTRGAAERTHAFPPVDTPMTVYIRVKLFAGWPDDQKKGIKALLVKDQRWSRCDLKTTGLLANVLAHQQAREQDACEAIFSRDGFITEGSHSNVFIVKNNKLITPPLSNFLLAGITRQAILDCASNMNIDNGEEPVTEIDLMEADEVFITGTTVEITPVVCINNDNIRKGIPGFFTGILQSEFNKIKIGE